MRARSAPQASAGKKISQAIFMAGIRRIHPAHGLRRLPGGPITSVLTRQNQTLFASREVRAMHPPIRQSKFGTPKPQVPERYDYTPLQATSHPKALPRCWKYRNRLRNTCALPAKGQLWDLYYLSRTASAGRAGIPELEAARALQKMGVRALYTCIGAGSALGPEDGYRLGGKQDSQRVSQRRFCLLLSPTAASGEQAQMRPAIEALAMKREEQCKHQGLLTGHRCGQL